MSRHTVTWLIPILLTVHNAEEAFALRVYLPRLRTLLPAPLDRLVGSLSYSAVLGALTVLSVLAFLVALAAATHPMSRRALWALLVLEAAVAINVVGHVFTAATVFHGYSPGLATAILLNAPFAIYCFRRVQHEAWISPAALQATIPAALILHGPILLAGLWVAGRASR